MRQLDLTGMKFGRLTAIRPIRQPYTEAKWVCQCECGTEKQVLQGHLRKGSTRSCGCLNSEVTAARNRSFAIHGMWKSNEFTIWQGMMQRCSPDNLDACKRRNYADRGIVVCQRWRDSFEAFYADMGPRPSSRHSLDRFPNQDGNYEPGNVRWATSIEQGNNRRNNVYIDVGGERLTIAQFARRNNLTKGCVRLRLKRGLVGEALAARPHPGKNL